VPTGGPTRQRIGIGPSSLLRRITLIFALQAGEFWGIAVKIRTSASMKKLVVREQGERRDNETDYH
jgi:hypothetical protein